MLLEGAQRESDEKNLWTIEVLERMGGGEILPCAWVSILAFCLLAGLRFLVVQEPAVWPCAVVVSFSQRLWFSSLLGCLPEHTFLVARLFFWVLGAV